MQMFWRLDNGEAVNIGSIPDAKLRVFLQRLFELLRLPQAGKVLLHYHFMPYHTAWLRALQVLHAFPGLAPLIPSDL